MAWIYPLPYKRQQQQQQQQVQNYKKIYEEEEKKALNAFYRQQGEVDIDAGNNFNYW